MKSRTGQIGDEVAKHIRSSMKKGTMRELTAVEYMALIGSGRGVLLHTEVRHDDWCMLLVVDGAECNCRPTVHWFTYNDS